MHVYECVISIDQKTNHRRNVNFGSVLFRHIQLQLETFYKEWTKILLTEPHKNILIH